MENKENLNDILKKVNEVDSGVNNLIIPILKDTIKDGNRHNTKLFIFAMAELIVILITIIISVILMYNQNLRYQEFLNQFEFETETIYQDVDAGDGSNSTINDRNKIKSILRISLWVELDKV